MQLTYPRWLDDAVIYQIYPQSFQDSNDDGIGDIPGLIQRLDYLSELGINTLWINPCFDSPFGDAGYDVRDFLKVAPRYGSNEELVELFEAAKSRKMRVFLDLVAGHTSIEHNWFKESSKGSDNSEANRYIWKNRDFDPSDGPTDENYVSNFFWYQPALNFGYANPTEDWQDSVNAEGPLKNRAMLKDVMRFWIDKGAAGFRVDMAASLVKEDQDHKETIKLWQELRVWLQETYPEAALIAEWSYPSQAVEAGFHLDFLMHFNKDIYRSLFFNEEGTIPYLGGTCYFHHSGKGTPWNFLPGYLEELEKTKGKGFISLPTANHDFQRLRCGPRSWEQLKTAWVFLMTQAGPPTIYMGDEIGMRFVPGTPPKEGSTLVGMIAPNAGTANGERSGTRTPFQWDNSMNNGFSSAETGKLYLPIDPDEQRPNAEDQRNDPKSLYNFVKELISLRSSRPSLASDASYEPMTTTDIDYPLVIKRSDGVETTVIAINPSENEASIQLKDIPSNPEVLMSEGLSLSGHSDNLRVNIAPFGFAIFST